MKQIAPDYYEKFKCIADKCRHNCCIGWEIDVDEFTIEYYNSLSGEIGDKLKKNISYDGDVPHFCLGENERCPFLMKNNLCELICKLGDDALCDICADHPRFRNYFSDREEIGLGLCCESAGRLILSNESRVELVAIYDDGEREEITEEEEKILKLREELFLLAQREDKSLNEKISLMLSATGAQRKERKLSGWADVFLSMERLDEKWTELLLKLKTTEETDAEKVLGKEWEKVFSQLLHYFIYRQFSLSAEDERIKERLIFAIDSCLFIREICAFHKISKGALSLDDIVEYCRMYSSEMEYSEENVENYLNLC